ncbi:MAG: hemerythrin domain-containing protein [Acidimicrobiia bacterium]
MPTKTTAKKTVKKSAKKVVKQATKAAKTTKAASKKAGARARTTTSKRPAARDVIAVLKADHHDVEQLFRAFEKAGDHAYAEKRDLANRMVSALSVHAAVEEQILYPWVRATIQDADDQTLEALEEHHVVKWLLSEIEDMDPEHERFDAKVTVLTESVRHHVREEETEMFVDLRQVGTRAELLELGEQIIAAKRNAPTRPHPRSADTPPMNRIGGTVNAALDHARDVGREVVGALGSIGPSSE